MPQFGWPTDLIAETQLNPATLCRLFKIEPRVGAVLLFTDHDQPVTVDGDTYLPDHSIQTSAIDNTAGGASQNLEMTVLFTDALIGYDAALRGVYNSAAVTVWLASYGNPGASKGMMLKGRIASVSLLSKLYGTMTVAGGSGKMQRTMTEIYQPTCRADFGDARCTLHLADFSAAFTVASVTDEMTFVTGLTPTADQYNLGSVVWATGNNAGRAQEVAYSLETGAVALFYPPPYTIVAGDTGTIYQGCAKTVAACTAYGNLPNFRGEPNIPGDVYTQTV